MKRKSLVFLFSMFILMVLVSIFILHGLTSTKPLGHLELLEVKDEVVQSIHCKIFYLEWHGRTTELEFTLYRRSRVAGYGVPGTVGAQWNQTNGNVVKVRDGDVCLAKNGDAFKLTISIFAAYIRISYDNKTVHVSGTTDELTEFPR